VDCNSYVKFGALLGRARLQYGCEAVATGHYARRRELSGGGVQLLRAVDPEKDQSYFLYGLRQDQLRFARFPLGSLTKREVRETARSLGLATAEKPESQEICFVPGGDYRAILRERAGWGARSGPLVDLEGREVGRHEGVAGFTVGQRHGLGVALGEPRYVSSLDPVTNTIQIARREDLESRLVEIQGMTFVAGEAPTGVRSLAGNAGPAAVDPAPSFRAQLRIRHRATPVEAVVRPAPSSRIDRDRRWLAATEQPVWAAAPGQAAVLYDGDVVIGGGRIARPAGRAGMPDTTVAAG
jgi:tRNA-specific 2-thiouridylase